jgi:hypothetical protein
MLMGLNTQEVLLKVKKVNGEKEVESIDML